MLYRRKIPDIDWVISKYSKCFSSFTRSKDPNKLISPLKMDGTKPRLPRKDKTYIYLNTGVIGEQGYKHTNIFSYLHDYHGIQISNVKYANRKPKVNISQKKYLSKFEPAPSTKLANFIETINYMQVLPQNIAEGYFNIIRGIDIEYLAEFIEKIKYQSTLCVRNIHNLFIPFDNNQGYQKMVLCTDFQKQKAEIRVLRINPETAYRTTVIGSSDSKYILLTEGIEDAMALAYCLKYNYLYHSVLQKLFKITGVEFPSVLNQHNTAVICCYGKMNLVKIAREIPNAIIIADNDTFTDGSQPVENITVVVPYTFLGEVCKDFNQFLVISRSVR